MTLISESLNTGSTVTVLGNHVSALLANWTFDPEIMGKTTDETETNPSENLPEKWSSSLSTSIFKLRYNSHTTVFTLIIGQLWVSIESCSHSHCEDTEQLHHFSKSCHDEWYPIILNDIAPPPNPRTSQDSFSVPLIVPLPKYHATGFIPCVAFSMGPLCLNEMHNIHPCCYVSQ